MIDGAAGLAGFGGGGGGAGAFVPKPRKLMASSEGGDALAREQRDALVDVGWTILNPYHCGVNFIVRQQVADEEAEHVLSEVSGWVGAHDSMLAKGS